MATKGSVKGQAVAESFQNTQSRQAGSPLQQQTLYCYAVQFEGWTVTLVLVPETRAEAATKDFLVENHC